MRQIRKLLYLQLQSEPAQSVPVTLVGQLQPATDAQLGGISWNGAWLV